MIGYDHDELGLKLKHLIIDKLTIIYKGPVEVCLCFLEDLYEMSNILTFLYELVQENSKLTGNVSKPSWTTVPVRIVTLWCMIFIFGTLQSYYCKTLVFFSKILWKNKILYLDPTILPPKASGLSRFIRSFYDQSLMLLHVLTTCCHSCKVISFSNSVTKSCSNKYFTYSLVKASLNKNLSHLGRWTYWNNNLKGGGDGERVRGWGTIR